MDNHYIFDIIFNNKKNKVNFEVRIEPTINRTRREVHKPLH